MFLHERHCNVCERTAAHVNGECMNCRDNLEKESFEQFIGDRQSKTVEERLDLIEKWMYESDRKMNIANRYLNNIG